MLTIRNELHLVTSTETTLYGLFLQVSEGNCQLTKLNQALGNALRIAECGECHAGKSGEWRKQYS